MNIGAIRQQCETSLELQRLQLVAELHLPRTTEEARSIDPAEQRRKRDRLNQIERAQQRICKGQFAVCQNCRQQIDKDRLLAQPAAEFCITCQRQLEQMILGRRQDRKLTTTA
jgi:DnaK suppressor protein